MKYLVFLRYFAILILIVSHCIAEGLNTNRTMLAENKNYSELRMLFQASLAGCSQKSGGLVESEQRHNDKVQLSVYPFTQLNESE